MSSVTITGNYKKIHINLEEETIDASNNIVLKYNILNNTNGTYINCYFNLFLATELLNKTVNIKLEHLDSNVVHLTENLQITSSSPLIKKNCNLFTPVLLLTITSEQFAGHIYGNIKKTDTIDTSTSTETTTTVTDPVNLPTSYDAFGRFRTSQPFTLFDNLHTFSKGTKFTEYTNNTGSAAFNPTDSSVDLTVVNQANSMIIRETKTVFSYQPGKSLLILNTFAFNNTANNNLIQRVGYFTGYGQTQYNLANNFAPRNGIYIEASGNTIYMNKANGGTVTKVSQSLWNGYKFDGSAPYYVTLDVTKAQIFWIDIEWLGVGSVRTGFIVNGQYIIAHIFHHANISSTTYMQTACLPIRYELINTTTGTGGSMKQICSSVISEGGYDAFTPILHAGLNNTVKDVIAENSRLFTPIVSIKLKDARLNSIVLPCQLSVLSTTADNVIYKILLNADITGAYFKDVNIDSSVQYDTSGSSVTGGIELNSGYIKAESTLDLASKNDFNLQLGKYFSLDASGNPQAYSYKSDTITIVTSLVKNTNSAYSISGVIGWYDILK